MIPPSASSPPRSRHAAFLCAAGPLALALALAAGPASAANNLPVPSNPPPGSGSNWSGVTPGSGYDPTATTGALNVTAARAYAEWAEFNLTGGSTLNINGQNPDWILVNKVTGVGASNASLISGTINATGQVWLINPNGIVATNGALFNVGGLMLSTATGFDKAGFLSGSLTWTFTGATQPVQMDGTVNATTGVVAFLAPQIEVGGVVTGGPSSQFVAIAAQDVSLTFAQDGGLLYQLDGATITQGVAGSGSPSTPVGGFTQSIGSRIQVGRIFIAAAGQTAPSQILVSGALTATAARGDGQDIVLMTADQAPAGSPQVVASHVAGQAPGQVNDQALTTDGGDITLSVDATVNTLNEGSFITPDPAAADGAGLVIRAAGAVTTGYLVNAVGDLDIKAIGDIGTGDLGGLDVALQSGGDINVGNINARDDVVVRADGGFTALDIATGANVLGLDPTDPNLTNANEAGERLVARTQPISIGSTAFDLVGHDVDVIAGHVSVGGVFVTDNGPAQSGPSAPPTDLSSIRLQTTDPLTGGVTTNALTATADILIDAIGDVSTSELQAGRDIAIRSVNGSVDIIGVGNVNSVSAVAGDDIVLRAGNEVYASGSLTTLGDDGLLASQPNQAGDLLAALDPLNAFSPAGPGQAGGVAFGLNGSEIDVKAGDILIQAPIQAVGDARFVSTDGRLILAGVSADTDILIDGDGDVSTNNLNAGRDIGVRAYLGAVSIGNADAGDDIVLRTGFDAASGNGITVEGNLSTRGANDPTTPGQAGDLLAAADPVILSTPYAVNDGSDIDILAHTGDLKVFGSIEAPDDVRLQTDRANTGAIFVQDVTADNGSLLLDGDSVEAGFLTAFVGDVAIRARTGDVDFFSASAGDDIVIRAGGSLSVSDGLTSGAEGGVDSQGAGDRLIASNESGPMKVSPGGPGFDLAGADIDVVVGTSLPVGGAAPVINPNASVTLFGDIIANGPGSDLRVQAQGGVLFGGPSGPGDPSASQDIFIDGSLVGSGSAADVTVTDLLSAGRDVAVRSGQGNVTTLAIDAGDDIVLRASGTVDVQGTLTTHGQDSAAANQAGDLLAASDPINAYSSAGPGQPGGAAFALNGADIDIKAGAILVEDVTQASGSGSDARFQATGTINLLAVSADQDILIDAGLDVSTGALSAGRDIAARSYAASMDIESADAQDDIVLRAGSGAPAGGAINVEGALTTHGVNDATGADQSGDLLAAAEPMLLSTAYTVDGGSDIDVLAHVQGIDVSGFIDAFDDARLQTDRHAGGNIFINDALAENGDLLLDGGANVDANILTAERGDVAVRARTGTVEITSASAGDDVAIRAAGNISVFDALTSGAKGGVDSQGAADRLVAVNESGPMKVSGLAPGFDLAGNDIDIVAGTSLAVGSTPVVIDAAASVTLLGPVAANGPGSDMRIQAQGGVNFGSPSGPGELSAGQDILIDMSLAGTGSAADLNVPDALIAGRDVAVRSGQGSVTTLDIDAQDDIVLRAFQRVEVDGALTTHGANDAGSAGQAGDVLAVADPITLAGALGVNSGSDIDVMSHLGDIDIVGAIDAAGDARLQTDRLGAGAVFAHQVTAETGDVLLDGSGVQANILTAAGDVAVRARTGAVSLISATAGDDIVLRAAQNLAVSGALNSGSGSGANGVGVADGLAAQDPILTYWATTPSPYTTADGHDIDIRAGGSIALFDTATAAGAGSDIRLDSEGSSVTVVTLRQTGGTGGEQVLAAGVNFTVSGQIDAPTADVLLFARPTALQGGALVPVTLGGASGGSGFVYDNGEISRTKAASLSLFSGVDPTASANAVIQDVQFTATLRTIRVYAGGGARVDVAGQVTDPAGTNGLFVIGAAATDPHLAVFNQGVGTGAVSGAWAPDVIRISGGIGATGNPLSRVTLAASAIYIAPTNDTALGTDFETAAASQAPETMPAYAGPVTIQIRTGSLELRASQSILERNLQPGATLSDGVGLQLGALTVDRLSNTGAEPTRVSLFGLLDPNRTGVLTSTAPSGLIGGIPAAFLLRYAPAADASVPFQPPFATAANYRFNTCAFGGVGCFTQIDVSNPGGPITSIPGLGGGDAGGADGGVTGGGGGGGGDSGLLLPNPNVIGDILDPFTPVDEEPVTNAGGEVEWLPTPGPEQSK